MEESWTLQFPKVYKVRNLGEIRAELDDGSDWSGKIRMGK